jgi:voltage-gated potassium channel
VQFSDFKEKSVRMSFFKKVNDIITPWEFAVLLGLVYVLFDVPLGAAFKHSVTKPEMFFDLLVTGVMTWHALNKKSHNLIAKYPRLNHIAHWIPCLPLMTLSCLAGANGDNWPIYLQLPRLFALHTMIAEINERTKTRLVPKRLKFIMAFAGVSIALNYLACIWLVIYPPGQDPLTDYNKAMYWLITTIATVGYGDITPNTNGGRVYAMGIMILGATIWGIMIASASRMMLASDSRKERKKEKMEALHSFFNHYEVPKHLQEQVVGFFNHLWSRKVSEDEQTVLSELPPALQSELQTYMNLKPISRVSLFKNVSFECLSAASKKLEQVFFAPGEKIISRGEMGAEMYLIGHGNVIIHNGEQYITTLGEGTCFGEMALIGDGLRSTDVTASSYCDVFKLSKERFDELFTAHADLRQNIERLARERQQIHKQAQNISAPVQKAG